MHKLVSRRPNARRLGPAANRCPVPTRAAGPPANAGQSWLPSKKIAQGTCWS